MNVQASASLLLGDSGDVTINGDPGTAAVYGSVSMSGAGRLTRRGTGTRALILGSGSRMTISGSPVAQWFYDLAIEGTTNALSNLIVYHHTTISEGATLHGDPDLVTMQLSGTVSGSSRAPRTAGTPPRR